MSKSRQKELMDMYIEQGLLLEDVFDIIIALEHMVEDLRSQLITQEQTKTK